MSMNAASIYKKNQINTATPEKLTLMLYNGAIKFCNIASEAIDENNINLAHTNIIKAQNIITHFRATLDFKYPVAQEFENVYSYVFERLVEANLKKDKEILEEVLEHLREMRDTWSEVMKSVQS